MLIHRLTHRRTNHRNLHVRGYKEEGTTTTPFDMVVLNDLDPFHLVALIEPKQDIARHGENLLAIRNWKWSLGTRNRS